MTHDRGNVKEHALRTQADRTAATVPLKAGDRVLVREPDQDGRATPRTRAVVVGTFDWFGVRCVDVKEGNNSRRVVAERVRRTR